MRRLRQLAVMTLSSLTTLVVIGCVEQQTLRPDQIPAAAANADDLLVVDCLLPGQIRKLGSRLTYLTARRPIQTTRLDCEIRGGEYVLYDRATYESALKLWLPAAEQGDPEAQNRIGEIYERGVGGPPNYAKAAEWFRRAAEQGLAKAQINLGFLYEKGLGVPQDPEQALYWYRKASKLPDAVLIDKRALAAQKAELERLRQELDRTRDALAQARRQLRERERRLERQRRKLEKALEQRGNAPISAADRKKLAQLEKQRQELLRQQARIRELEKASQQQKQRLLLLAAEGATLREQLKLVRGQLESTLKELDRYRKLTAENEKRLAETRAQLEALSAQRQGAAFQRIRDLQKQLHEREERLAAQQVKIAQLQERIKTIDGELKKKQSLSQSERKQLEADLARARKALAQEQAQARQRDQALAKLKNELESARSQLSASQARVAALEAQLHEREKTLEEQKETLARLQKESEQWKQKLKQLESQRQLAATSSQTQRGKKGKERSGTEPPKIELIEPRLVAVRSNQKVMIPVKRGLKKRTIIGRVDAPAGLYALTLNGARIKADPEGLFETDILVAGDRTPVNLVAIDRRGRRSTLSFEMVVQRSGKITARKLIPLKPDEVGNFYALVIGNQHYKYLPSLDTSINDAKAVAKVLKEKFGYKVTLLLDATRYQILSELNKLRKKLTDKDNLLIYYAGHGELDRVNLRGQWLPVDAEAGNTANWISNISITDILNAMAARHILLVADSCYSGTLTRSALTDIEAGKTEEERLNWIKTLAKMRSRTALTSGGLAPVLDGGGGDHSVFAKAFLDSLASLDDISEGQKVYREVAARVAYVASRYQVEQVPQYAPIKYAGHEAGDYIFIPEDLL